MSVNVYENGALTEIAGNFGSSVDVLDTKTEIQANTETGKSAGALGVKELLGGISFGVDADGNYGYYKAGADTVTPFSSGKMFVGSFKMKQGVTHNISNVPFKPMGVLTIYNGDLTSVYYYDKNNETVIKGRNEGTGQGILSLTDNGFTYLIRGGMNYNTMYIVFENTKDFPLKSNDYVWDFLNQTNYP